MATIKKFEELEIWQLARKLYNKITAVATLLRQQKEFRFAEQMKSSSGSIMDNIAEGFERSSRLEFLNSLSISKEEFEDFCLDTDVLSKKLASFIMYLNTTNQKGLKFKDRT